MFDVYFLINQENKSNKKRKNLLKSLLICIDFNVAYKKFSGGVLICIDFNVTYKKFSEGDTPGTSSKDRPSAGQRALRARFVKTQQHPPPPNFSRSATVGNFMTRAL